MIGRKLDAKKQQAFIEAYEELPNSLGPHKAVVFTDGEIRRMWRAAFILLNF